MAFTAEFKILGVRAGTCTQTIRPIGARPKERGDMLLLHGWTDRPYRSPWSWRIPEIMVTNVMRIKMDFWKGVYFYTLGRWENWDSFEVNQLASRDGFTAGAWRHPGLAMKDWFFHTYGELSMKDFHVIEWSGQKIIIDNMKKNGTFNPTPDEQKALSVSLSEREE